MIPNEYSDEFLLSNLAELIAKDIMHKESMHSDEHEKYVNRLKGHFFAHSETFKQRFVEGYALLQKNKPT